MRAHLEDIGALTHSFYEAAVQPELWGATLQKASAVFGADGTCIIAFPSSAVGAVWSPGLDELADPWFNDGWHANNERLARALPRRHFEPVLTESDLFNPEELDRHPFNAEFINRHGFRWCTGCFLSEVDGWVTAFTAERKAKREPFASAETRALASILPHLQRATEVASRLALAKGTGMLEAFEKMSCAALLLGCTGKVLRFNAQASNYIGRDLRIVQGCLMTAHNGCNGPLQRLIGSVLSAPGKEPLHRHNLATIARQDPARRPLFALAMPIVGAAQDVFQQSKAMILIIDPDGQLSPPELILRTGFGLTRAETRLAIALANGVSLSDFAERQKVSIGTARFQLKVVLAKTSTHRQAELVALLGRLSILDAGKVEDSKPA